MSQRKVIDMWAPVLPTREVMTHVADNYPEAQLGYLKVFSKRELNLEDYQSYALRLAREDPELIADLDAAGIMRAVITGFDERTTAGKTFVENECVAAGKPGPAGSPSPHAPSIRRLHVQDDDDRTAGVLGPASGSRTFLIVF